MVFSYLFYKQSFHCISLLRLSWQNTQTEQLKHRNSFLIIQRLGSPRSMFQRGRFHGAASPPGRVVATILLCAHMTSLNTGRERKTVREERRSGEGATLPAFYCSACSQQHRFLGKLRLPDRFLPSPLMRCDGVSCSFSARGLSPALRAQPSSLPLQASCPLLRLIWGVKWSRARDAQERSTV